MEALREPIVEALRESMRGKSWKPTGREGDKILAVEFGKGGAKEKQKKIPALLGRRPKEYASGKLREVNRRKTPDPASWA